MPTKQSLALHASTATELAKAAITKAEDVTASDAAIERAAGLLAETILRRMGSRLRDGGAEFSETDEQYKARFDVDLLPVLNHKPITAYARARKLHAKLGGNNHYDRFFFAMSKAVTERLQSVLVTPEAGYSSVSARPIRNEYVLAPGTLKICVDLGWSERCTKSE